jgi:hypothetical protein
MCVVVLEYARILYYPGFQTIFGLAVNSFGERAIFTNRKAVTPLFMAAIEATAHPEEI